MTSVAGAPHAGLSPLRVEAFLEDIRRAAPMLGARAAEIEAARRMLPDVVASLRGIGVFRMAVPEQHGGFGFDQPAICRALAALSAIDGAIGWVSLIGTAGEIAMGMLGADAYARIYRNGPDVVAAGASMPTGTAAVVDGGYRVNGRWALASGCQHADWMFGMCIVVSDGAPAPGPEPSRPATRMVFLPAEEWEIEDTWKAEGLKGSGSHHIAVHDRFAPESCALDVATARPEVEAPMYQRGGFNVFPTHHAAFAVGLAEGALSEFAIASASDAVGAAAQKGAVLAHYAFGRAEADVRAARALMEAQADMDAALAREGRIGDRSALLRRAQTASWVTEACQRAIDECYRLGGSGAVYETSPLQRRMRDMRAAAQHLWGQARHYAPAGQLRLEGPADASPGA